MIKFLMTKYDISRYLLSSATLTTCSFTIALRLSATSQIIVATVLIVSFLVAGSVSRGLFALFMGIAVATLLGSLSFPTSSFDTPNFVFITSCSGSFLFLLFMRRRLLPVRSPMAVMELAASLPLFATSLILRPITYVSTPILFANLGIEDNASWIHAASGYLRFNATATQVSNDQYGSAGFLSTQLSFFTTVSEWGSDLREIQLVLISVINTYIFCILMASFFTVIVCAQLFSYLVHGRYRGHQTPLSLLALSGIPTTVLLGILMSRYGHLSLITVIMVIWITFWLLHEFSVSNLTVSKNVEGETFQIWSQLVVVLMIGSIWFPLIPISSILIVSIIVRNTHRVIKSRHETFPSFDIHPISIKFFISALSKSVLAFIFAIAAFRLLRFPAGYSASMLINADGGTYTITGLVLALALMGLLFSTNSSNGFTLQSVLAIILILELMAVWILSLNANPEIPGYSVQKFAVLIAAIGIPLATCLITSHLLAQSRNWIFLLAVPVVATFSMLQLSFGINSFPRSSTMEVSRTSVWNYQEDLIKLASENKGSQILCLSNSTELNIYAYICSRFASAFQFKERGDGDLARRWRSQILDTSVDPARFKTQSDYGVQIAVRNYLDKGGSLIVALIPGPLWEIQNQTERQWVKELPWSELGIYWQK